MSIRTSCIVTDNVAVNTVMLNITNPNNDVQNFSIINNKTGDKYSCNRMYVIVGEYTYFIWANDSSGNANVSAVYSFNVVDTKSPDITGVQADPDCQHFGDYVNISCDVFDVVGVDMVMLNITYPDNSMENISITSNKTDDSYYCNRTYTLNGTYHFFIWANDTNGNANISTTYSFVIKNMSIPDMVNYSILLNEDWNLMSLPVNQSIQKDDITVSCLGENYTWEDAVSADIVMDAVFMYDGSYWPTSVLVPGEGYWMFAYVACDLWISSNVSKTDDNITDLLMDWNMVGLPYNESINKNDLMIYCNEEYYSWEDAVSADIVMDAVFMYDGSYWPTSVLVPGR